MTIVDRRGTLVGVVVMIVSTAPRMPPGPAHAAARDHYRAMYYGASAEHRQLVIAEKHPPPR